MNKDSGRPQLELDEEKIYALYTKEGMSLRDIAKIYEVSPTTIANRLKLRLDSLKQWRLPGCK